jgi:O-succinylbenzoic acid--CoA ligase
MTKYLLNLSKRIVAFSGDCSLKALHILLQLWDQGKIACPINPRIPLFQRQLMVKRLEAGKLLREEDIALLLFTSGSSGRPKIAALSYRALLRNARAVIEILKITSDDYWHLSLPLYHVGGVSAVVRSLLAQATVGRDGQKATLLSLVPTQLYRMLNTLDPLLLHKKAILIGGGPVSPLIVERAKRAELPIWTTWGMTETSSVVALNGKILPGREVKIGADGEIFVRGEILFSGYLQEDGSLFSPLIDGWLSTGDLGYFTSNTLFIRGRKDRLFITYGENVQPEEIEAEILKIPEILRVTIIPIPDLDAGAFPIAFVEAIGEIKEAHWRSLLKELLPSFKVPRRFLKFPPNFGLKVSRQVLIQYALRTLCN